MEISGNFAATATVSSPKREKKIPETLIAKSVLNVCSQQYRSPNISTWAVESLFINYHDRILTGSFVIPSIPRDPYFQGSKVMTSTHRNTISRIITAILFLFLAFRITGF